MRQILRVFIRYYSLGCHTNSKILSSTCLRTLEIPLIYLVSQRNSLHVLALLEMTKKAV